ncbi:AraC family transcriptional regulator [Gilliamella sp. ESL0441]|uniref:zinc ribbon domain-containing protein n=1 Tax=Gilliamella sp. ESL0441 TaxID=2704654 RepID=UPI001C694626|nr:zinc ribbon domain-containing protein [Gilliamella sp. ESL0441]QYN44446.1 AraC family transcriptional regulator [Gilliamella sp. ESL0441]
MKMCIACGMPMTCIADYPLHDLSKNYCKYCAHENGSMKSFDEKWQEVTLRYAKNHNVDYPIAKQTAYVILKKLPAWKRQW